MANEENLIPNSERSPEEVRENGRKGGIKSGETRRRQKNTRQILEMLATLPFNANSKKEKELRDQIVKLGIPENEITVELAMNYAQYLTAMSGKYNSVNAATYVRDTLGDKPADNMNVELGDSKKLKDVFEQIGGEGLDE